MLNATSLIQSRVQHADPVAMTLLSDASASPDTLGVFPQSSQLGALPVAAAVALYTKIRGITSAVGRLGIGGGSTSGAFEDIYKQIPQSMIRVTGGRGKWTDTLTGETMNDIGTEVRKSAMLVSSLGAFVNRDNWFFDDATGQHLSPDTMRARWDAAFGNGASPLTVMAKHPELFRTWGTNPALDPVISSVGKVEQTAPLPPNLRSGAQFGAMPLDGAPGPIGSGAIPMSGAPGTTMAGVSPMMLAAGIGLMVVLATAFRGKKRT